MVDQWAGSSDIFTDYDGTITDASFQTNEYGTQMKLTFDEIDGREEPVFEYYKVPDSYESNDGGVTIERIDGKDKAMSKNSKWMRFVMKAGSLGNAREELGDDAPLNASAWIGTRWHMEAEPGKPYSVTDRETGQKKEGVSKDINFPTAYLGKDTAVSTQSSGGTNGQAGTNSLSVLTDLSDPVLQSNINDWAKTLPYNDWFKQSYEAIQAAGIPANQLSDLITAMSRPEGLYASLGGKG